MISLDGLNPEQRSAAETVTGPVLILAGAGSGKTRTITYRIAHMLENLHLPGHQILAVSFTNKAAAEMQERVKKLVPQSKLRKGLTMSTFHSLGIRILREDIHHLGYNNLFTIYDSADQMSIIREALKNFRANKAFDRGMVQSKISWLKNKGISPDEFVSSEFYDPENPYDTAVEMVYPFYQDKLRFYNALDFDDILFLVVKLFEANPDVAKKYSDRWRYLMVDEYQDTNGLQFRFIQGLTSTHNNICVVGDDDQSIYAFRGADISNILNFEHRFPGAKVIKLEENYRSFEPILTLANRVIQENPNRKDKTMRTSQVGGAKPFLWSAADADHEAAVVVEDIIERQKDGVHLGEVAILYRSNTQIPPFEDQLRLNQVPYNIIGGQKFYEKKEIKDLIAYLTVIMNPRDELGLRRILNTPNRGIGTVTLEKYLKVSSETKSPLFNVIENEAPLNKRAELSTFTELIRDMKQIFETQSLAEGVKELIRRTDYMAFVEKSYDNTKFAQRKKEDVENFINSAQRFMDRMGPDATLRNFVERLLLADSHDVKSGGGDEERHEVTLMTLHSSKGLEYDFVYLVGMEEELLPHKKTIQENGDIGEERRLCYVGITRARKRLVMTHAKQRKLYGRDVPRHPSRFVVSHDEAMTVQDRTEFNGMTEEEIETVKDDFLADLIKSLN
ncbi:MAG: UvrD-helicase domain-containing protein [Bacteriovoracaceae bacterium]|nr:UvrD-helicase domain-containing protein [Bacteriovoracaceae bacterium]